MKRLDNVPTHLSRTFTGTYRLTGRMVEFDNAKTPFLKLRLSDCVGDQIAMLNLSKTTVPERIGHLDFVTASGVKCLSGQFLLDEFRKATREEVITLNTLQSLPRVYSPVPEVFDKLVATVQSLQSECLRVFLTRVLERKDRLEAFFECAGQRQLSPCLPGRLARAFVERR